MRCLSLALLVAVASTSSVSAAWNETLAEGTVAVIGNAPDGRGGFITRKAIVDLSNLDVRKADNAPVIFMRLQNAAASVCITRQRVDRELTEKLQKCRTRAIGNAIATIDNAELTRLAHER